MLVSSKNLEICKDTQEMLMHVLLGLKHSPRPVYLLIYDFGSDPKTTHFQLLTYPRDLGSVALVKMNRDQCLFFDPPSMYRSTVVFLS